MNSFPEDFNEIQGLLASAHVGVWSWDLTSGVVTWNAGMHQLFETNGSEFDGSYLFWRSRVHKDDIDSVEKRTRELIETGKATKIRYRALLPDGKVKVLTNFSRRVLGGDGHVLRIVGINVDVTDLVRTREDLELNERTLSQASQMAQMIIWEEDLRSGEVIVSAEGRSLWPESPKKRTFDDILAMIHPDDRARMRADRQRLLEERRVMDIEYRLVTSGGIRYRHSRAELIFDAAGVPVRMIGVTHDLTKHRQMEQERLQLQKKLLQIEKLDSLGTFAGGIAHDFNNFLAAISGQIEVALVRKKSASEMTDVLEKVLKTSQRAQDLVSRILAFSKVPQLRLENLQVQDLVQETVEILEASISEHIDLCIDLVADNLGIRADRIQLQQVLINIINNAAQALGSTPGKVQVSSKRVVQEIVDEASDIRSLVRKEFARVDISDTGPGIRPENLERIFDPMFTTKSPGYGTGLGLSVSQSIVRAHGGWITAVSEGAGTTFQIFLPLDLSIPRMKTTPSQIQKRQTEIVPLRRPTGQILLVDDDTEVLELLKEMLNFEFGADCVSAFSRPELAREAFCTDPSKWSLVITDLTMPGMSGVDICQTVQEKRSHLPVILMTGYDRSQVMSQVVLGANVHLLLKPFSIHNLKETVKGLWSSSGEVPPAPVSLSDEKSLTA